MYTIPQKHLFLNEEMFDNYTKMIIKKLEEGEKYYPIKETTAQNNEVTVIVGARKDDNWAFKVSEDVMKIIQVRSPGRVLGKFTPSNESVHVDDIENPCFKKRVWSLEVVLSDGILMKDFDRMNERARALGLIGKDERLLTIHDAERIVDSEELDQLNTYYRTPYTHRILKVHKDIPLGFKDPLIQCIVAQIRGTNTLEEIARKSLSHSL
ncbi:hypothetical protein lpari_00131 [Legionella parisiensis]|uniref:Uncharacterized protein n=1 Tax=Legionella parisiensis TaxID=45071 RepID=A0A1E5JWI2_9GAMM|nr:hypothetical protein [Legionella parisiensis]OEH48884.1 hypothetical protein lpari_00131 [Legionella parisiensis]